MSTVAKFISTFTCFHITLQTLLIDVRITNNILIQTELAKESYYWTYLSLHKQIEIIFIAGSKKKDGSSHLKIVLLLYLVMLYSLINSIQNLFINHEEKIQKV